MVDGGLAKAGCAHGRGRARGLRGVDVGRPVDLGGVHGHPGAPALGDVVVDERGVDVDVHLGLVVVDHLQPLERRLDVVPLEARHVAQLLQADHPVVGVGARPDLAEHVEQLPVPVAEIRLFSQI
eukprot:CAMPEP_0173472194 /NCGR_PEP_ID=MMETSP1357-20121228/78779_1 /TAXON_ID=77926 /ORGANISM="Hemiselmis rufescens, Strain PCC563" /LENGTH=124 /DNA_ID=CAMNT_0014440513 /DNA_START=102 /DNA_END=476 /DNA_ORIENTATION=-